MTVHVRPALVQVIFAYHATHTSNSTSKISVNAKMDFIVIPVMIANNVHINVKLVN